MVGIPMMKNIFTFTLMSTTPEQIVSKVSTVTSRAVDDTNFQCIGHSHPATVTVQIIG